VRDLTDVHGTRSALWRTADSVTGAISRSARDQRMQRRVVQASFGGRAKRYGETGGGYCASEDWVGGEPQPGVRVTVRARVR